ncbi:peptidase domain-containing ABC transporter [Chryseobacterium balustinum]|uniref:peptidase domain-containing ABC transporter n=1 Tax=Chryseobacterium balustinum TaxID=246 RepID=UPI003CED9861
MKKFPFYKQPDHKDCGPTCLRIISKFYGKIISLPQIRVLSETTREGSSLFGISDAAEKIGFRTLGVKINFNSLKDEVPLPCIVHWNKEHFVVVYKVKKGRVFVSDPSYGLLDYSADEFLNCWIGKNSTVETEEGLALLFEPTPSLKDNDWEQGNDRKSFAFLFKYLFKYKALLSQLIIGLVVSSLLSLFFPFLTQSIVDVGIQNQDLGFIYLVLLAQIMLFCGRTGIEIIRNWILLHLSSRINISLVSDFFIKLMKLPISFFDTRMTGDMIQRINDHKRIEILLTNSSLSTLFSLINIVVFSFVLAFYNWKIFAIFAIGSLLYIVWIIFFLKKRKELDHKNFAQESEEQSKVIEIINGMQEIKLHNAERQKRWGWEFVQIKIFKLGMRALSLEQFQTVGSNFINQLKDIIITFLSASLVIKGDITLGMMLSIQYIIGQLNSPLVQMVNFIRQAQDAKISLERLGEIHDKQDEEPVDDELVQDFIPANIYINNVEFRYSGSYDPVIKDLSLVIPINKTTAIVGSSGSGKTTLMKLLMKFYEVNQGEIKLGSLNFNNISPKSWRKICGVVMQEGYIFNDTIANNIAIGEDHVDKERLMNAVKIANIKDFVENLPLRYNTKIGNEGVGISGGQKQRLLIARAVYKNPSYIFFDEATSALDANNEKTIMENLNNFFKDRTAIIIAHRLSTVKRADQIIVMESGIIIEKGTHQELLELKGSYYNLVKNQLEMDKIKN